MMKMSGNHSVLFNIKLSKIHNPNSKSSTSSYSSTDSSIDSCMESGTGRSIGSFCNRSQCNNLDGSTTNNSINCDKRNNNKNPQRNGLTNYQDESNSFNNTVRRNAEGLLSHKYGVFKGVSGRRVCPIKTDRKVSARLIQPQPKSKVCL
ncbi:hypothetical protein TRFO_22104 [Tritrichomonas foetus]|uniref:Uncharacterized protein n=1 Tax=Tritrichomonas foetus TaxID=1144522 RepID=A0A1J4KIN3_9EUKA|nr:hypothetical protein TRFO_22104 [Tritrichomonas foetus]|eukprot:OHT09173.1 hypothetical protein TRFO_22104 [Tritrichomonas foetus]